MPVDLIDDPVKEAAIKSFGHGVAGLFGLFQRIISAYDFAVSDDAHRRQRLHYLCPIDSQQFRHCCTNNNNIATTTIAAIE